MHKKLVPLDDRGPLRVVFVITSMPVGGAETLLVNLIRSLDRTRFAPELCCLKEPGPLGETLADEIPVYSRLLAGKYDVRILSRLSKLLGRRRVDAVVTVGAGDKMFWGRLAAWRAGVPVVLSALHSTGWPDGVGRLNRLLTPLTDAFVAVAKSHGRHLVEVERFPIAKVHIIPNGVDVERFAPRHSSPLLCAELGLPPAAPLVGIVAALRPEKNHAMFLESASLVQRALPDARFLVVGDGPERAHLETLANRLGIARAVHFLGTRDDVPAVVSLLDVFALTSHIEANPVSILEAMALGKPVVATRVGSVGESVRHEETGFLVDPGSARQMADRLLHLLDNPLVARRMGSAGRADVVANWSLTGMVAGYESLVERIYSAKCGGSSAPGAGRDKSDNFREAAGF